MELLGHRRASWRLWPLWRDRAFYCLGPEGESWVRIICWGPTAAALLVGSCNLSATLRWPALKLPVTGFSRQSLIGFVSFNA